MGLLQTIRSVLTPSEPPSREGNRATRKLCVGDVKEDTVWLEVCSPDADDFRFQYGVPKRHYTMSQHEIDLVSELSDDDRVVYDVEMEARNENGTLWIVTSMIKVDELPPGYVKGRMYRL